MIRVFVAAWTVLPGLALLAISAWGLWDASEEADWVEVPAEVLDARAVQFRYTGEGPGGRTFTEIRTRVEARYAWTFDGQQYEGTRYRRLDPVDIYREAEDDEARKRLAALKYGGVTAWVDPDAPDQAVLEKSETQPPTVLGIAGGVLMVAGLLAVFGLTVRQRKRAPDA